jgi:hypothetical protein
MPSLSSLIHTANSHMGKGQKRSRGNGCEPAHFKVFVGLQDSKYWSPSLFALDSTMSSQGDAVSDSDHPASNYRQQLSAIEYFLDELTASDYKQYLEKETYNNNARLNTINSFITVVRVAANTKSLSL